MSLAQRALSALIIAEARRQTDDLPEPQRVYAREVLDQLRAENRAGTQRRWK